MNYRQLGLGAALVASMAWLPVQAAVVIDFNDPSLESVYAPFESFTQNGFEMTQLFDAGLVGTNADLGVVAPAGDATPYYTNFNNGALLITRVGGGVFTLDSFALAFVPLVPAPPGQTLYFGVVSFDAAGKSDFPLVFTYAPLLTAGYPFATYRSPSIAASYANVSALEFFSCSVNSTFDCIDAQNNGQFALDNVTLSVPVPEPATTGLMALGIALLIGQRIRRRV